MAMFIGTLRLRLRLPESASLKDKRQVVRSVVARLQRELRVAAAEVGELDRWQVAELGVACVTNEARHADEVIGKAQDFVERHWPELEIVEVETETIHAL